MEPEYITSNAREKMEVCICVMWKCTDYDFVRGWLNGVQVYATYLQDYLFVEDLQLLSDVHFLKKN